MHKSYTYQSTDAIRKRHLYIHISRIIQSENGIILLFYIFLSHGNEKKKKNKCKKGGCCVLSTSTCVGIPVNPPPFRGSLPRKSLISRMDWVSCAGDINLPHTPFPPSRYPPNKKIKYNEILTYILRSIFLEIPHLELPR